MYFKYKYYLKERFQLQFESFTKSEIFYRKAYGYDNVHKRETPFWKKKSTKLPLCFQNPIGNPSFPLYTIEIIFIFRHLITPLYSKYLVIAQIWKPNFNKSQFINLKSPTLSAKATVTIRINISASALPACPVSFIVFFFLKSRNHNLRKNKCIEYDS